MPEMGWGVYGAGAGAGLAIAFLAGFDALALALAGAFFATGFLAATFLRCALDRLLLCHGAESTPCPRRRSTRLGLDEKDGVAGASATKAASGASGRASKYGRVMGTSAT